MILEIYVDILLSLLLPNAMKYSLLDLLLLFFSFKCDGGFIAVLSATVSIAVLAVAGAAPVRL